MAAELVVLLLPRPDVDGAAIEQTLASVRAEAGAEVPILTLSADRAAVPAGVTAALPAELLSAGELIAVVRAGDRWIADTLEARLRPFRAQPSAVLGVAGHVRVDEAGSVLRTIQAPAPPFDPMELLLHPSIEASATVVRSHSLDPVALELLAAPYGDIVLWSRIVRAHGLLRSTEVAAEVRLDPARHGHAEATRTAELLAVVERDQLTRDGDVAGAATIRRELLRRLYVEPGSGTPDVALANLFGVVGDASVARIVEDLQWTLERQRDTLAAERARWPHGDAQPADELSGVVDLEVADLRRNVGVLGNEIAVRDAKIRRLEAEVYRRDAIIDGRAASSPEGAS